MLELFPYRATQVQEFELAFYFNPDFDKRTLLNMFPNLRCLKLNGMAEEPPATNYISRPFQFMHSTSKLESVCDIDECELTCQLAISNLGQHLKLLELQFRNSPLDWYKDVISQLKNMPVLQSLKLDTCPVELTYMEILHNNLPSITELEMTSSLIASSEIPLDVEPAIPITSLLFNFDFGADDLQMHIEFYKYLTKKYPSTNNFCCFDPGLRELHSIDVIEVYDIGIFPFLERIGTQLTGFTFENYCGGLEPFEILDEIGCKFKELTINSFNKDEYLFEDLTQSNQAEYIEILELNNIVPDPAGLLSGMKVLRSLIIDCSYSNFCNDMKTETELDLNQLLKACPATLTNLFSEFARVKCIGSRATFTPIIRLNLSHVKLTPELAKTIETSFPKLLELELHGLITDNITISLPNHNLWSVRIATAYEKGRRNAFSSKTITNGKLEYHASKQIQVKGIHGELETKEIIQIVSKEEVCDPLMLDFTCASARHIAFCSSEKYGNF
jgi:hypothetical protein